MSIRKLDKDHYQIDIYPAGQKGVRKRVNFSGSLIEALEFEKSLSSCFGGRKKKNTLVKSVLPTWINHCEKNNASATADDKKKMLKHLLMVFGTVPVSMLSVLDVDRYKSKRLSDGVINRTINKELSYFMSFITAVP